MKYFESNSDFTEVKINTPVDLVRYGVTTVFLSPLRMCIEISRKIIFVGDMLPKFLLNCVMLNSLMLLMSVLHSIFIIKGINISGGVLPFPSQIISLVLLVILYFLSKSNYIEMDFSGQSDVDLSEISEAYTESDVDIEVDSLEESDNITDVSEELEIIDYDTIEGEVNTIALEMPGIISNESKNRLDKMILDLKKDMNFSPPSANTTSLYSSVKEKEKECIDMIRRNRYSEEECVGITQEDIDRIHNNPKDYKELLGDTMTQADVNKFMEEHVKEQTILHEHKEEYYRAFEQMNPADYTKDVEDYLKYQDSYNTNVKASSTINNPEFHKFSNKELEIPMGQRDSKEDSEAASSILNFYNNALGDDEELVDPVFDFSDLISDDY